MIFFDFSFGTEQLLQIDILHTAVTTVAVTAALVATLVTIIYNKRGISTKKKERKKF